MSSESSWRGKTIFESFLTSISISVTNASLATWGLYDIYAVSPAVTARNTLRLAIETKTKGTQTTKLTHSSLRCTKKVQVTACHAYRSSALDTPVRRRSVRSKSWSLERQNLVRSKLLLIESLLLLLQRLDLVLQSNLL
jgi:hypothetical protein